LGKNPHVPALKMDRKKRILIIAEPNGAGKTTFATEFFDALIRNYYYVLAAIFFTTEKPRSQRI
jgi:predicted PilT family ATPase